MYRLFTDTFLSICSAVACIIQIALMLLKFKGIVAWSWWLILAPSYGAITLLVLLCLWGMSMARRIR